MAKHQLNPPIYQFPIGQCIECDNTDQPESIWSILKALMEKRDTEGADSSATLEASTVGIGGVKVYSFCTTLLNKQQYTKT